MAQKLLKKLQSLYPYFIYKDWQRRGDSSPLLKIFSIILFFTFFTLTNLFALTYSHKFINLKKCSLCHPKKNYNKIIPTKANCTTGICHEGITKDKYVHGPVGMKHCLYCHKPHDSKYKKLLNLKDSKLCYFCHREKKKEFTRKFVHAPVKEGKCTNCHDPHESNLKYQLKAKSMQNFCFKCHNKKKFTGKKYVHGPVGVGKCIDCHDPHASNKEFLLKENNKAKILCFKCHDKNRIIGAKYVHGPVGGGLCYKCHDPHCSNNKKLLKKTILEGNLCFECHNKYKIIDSKYVHGPVGAGLCLSCHKIHSSNYNFLLRDSKNGGKLCFNCHKDAKIKFNKRYIHKPVKKDCTNCHDAHSSPFKFQLIGNPKIDVCLKCHKKIKAILDKCGNRNTHPIIDERGCKACHNPHASNYKYQLFNNINKLCKHCHPKFKFIKRNHPVERHPVKGGRNPLNRKEKFSCASCHNPHGSKYKFLLIGTLNNFEICRKCHVNY